MQKPTISTSKYLSVAINLAESCGLVMRNIYESGDLKKRDKSANNPVTIADLTIQKTIETNFKHFFPEIEVRGEESKESIEQIKSVVDPEEI